MKPFIKRCSTCRKRLNLCHEECADRKPCAQASARRCARIYDAAYSSGQQTRHGGYGRGAAFSRIECCEVQLDMREKGKTMSARARKQVLILGGGFGGLYAALGLEKTLARKRDVQVTLVNRQNFSLFTPMLHEVAAGDLDMTHIVNPLRKLLSHGQLFHGEVERIDLISKT